MSTLTLTNDVLDSLDSLSDSELIHLLLKEPLPKRTSIINQMATHKTATQRAMESPAGLAETSSQGRWMPVRHLTHLNQVLLDSITGKTSKRLIVAMPPRHGKSELCSNWLPAWFIGKHPDRRVILTSYEASFAEWWGGKARESLEKNSGLFNVMVRQDSRAKSHWDIANHSGGMDTAGVGGPITGKGAHLLIVDDPIKNDEDASSEARRESIWDWWLTTALTRLEPNGIAIVIATRWHEDDLTGRILRQAESDPSLPQWRVVKFPAVAEQNDELGRQPGEALWPERYSVEALSEHQSISRVWNSLFQQNPIPDEGTMFKREWLSKFVDSVPAEATRAIRGWDKAGTEGGGDYSAGALVVEHSGLFYIVDVVRGQWSAWNRNQIMRTTTENDGEKFDRYTAWIEREPSASGKESAELSIRELAGYDVHEEPATKDKATRAKTFAIQAEAGNVRLVKGGWNQAFINELCSFPNGKNDDQVDAAALAFNKLARPRRKLLIGTGATVEQPKQKPPEIVNDDGTSRTQTSSAQLPLPPLPESKPSGRRRFLVGTG